MVSIANALAVYAGLTNFTQSQAIFDNLEQARLAAGVKKPGLSLYPFYPDRWPDRFFEYPGMGYGHYQNGGYGIGGAACRSRPNFSTVLPRSARFTCCKWRMSGKNTLVTLSSGNLQPTRVMRAVIITAPLRVRWAAR